MKLVTFEVGQRVRAGILEGDAVIDAGASMKEVIAAGVKRGARFSRNSVTLKAPLPDPGLVLSVGMNYHEHLQEMKTPVPQKPAAFTKSVASIIASGQPIKVPPSNPDMLDRDGEFSVVIARPSHGVEAPPDMGYLS